MDHLTGAEFRFPHVRFSAREIEASGEAEPVQELELESFRSLKYCEFCIGWIAIL